MENNPLKLNFVQAWAFGACRSFVKDSLQTFKQDKRSSKGTVHWPPNREKLLHSERVGELERALQDAEREHTGQHCQRVLAQKEK